MNMRAKKLLVYFLAVAMMVTFIPTISFAATTLSAPKSVKAKVVSETAVLLSWAKVKNASGYKVYCKESGGKYKLVKRLKSGKTVKWTKRSLKPGKTYSFKIKAYKGKINSKSSTAAIAKPYKGITSMKKDVSNAVKKVGVNVEYAHQFCRDLAYNTPTSNRWGFRHAGSEAEKQTADWIVKEMEEIGLTDVEKVEVLTDKWQEDEVTFTVGKKAGTGSDKKIEELDIDQICSQASTATGTYTGDIVYLNHGYEADYESYYDEMGLKGEDRNMNGKIVLCDIHQYAEHWIASHYIEAYNQGAEGIIVYSSQYVDENGNQTGIEKWDNACQCQDLCALDHEIPCMSISRADGLKLLDKIKEIAEDGAEQDVELTTNNTVVQDQPSYNVIGKIKGKSNSGQQIMLAGHYDKYWVGYQDDSMAVAIIMGVAKSLIDSGYQPENDIVIVAHGSEEWGRVGVEADWAQGSWEMITEAHPEWSGKTIALFNFELPAMNGGMYREGPGETYIGSVTTNEEIEPNTHKLNASELFEIAVPKLKLDNLSVRSMSQPLADCICYQMNGIPFIQINMNHGVYENPYGFSIYHTMNDNEETFDEGALQYHMAYTTAYLIRTDKLPAQQMDFTLRIAELKSLIEDESMYRSVDIKAYKEAIANLETVNKKYTAKVNSINNRYQEAVLSGASKSEISKIRAEGTALNKKSMRLFQYLQDEFIAFEGSYDCTIKHAAPANTYHYLQNMLECFDETGNLTDKARFTENAVAINKYIDKVALDFSKDTSVEWVNTVNCEYEQDTWTYGRQTGAINVVDATYDVLHTNGPFTKQIKKFKRARDEMKNAANHYLKREVKAINNMVEYMTF